MIAFFLVRVPTFWGRWWNYDIVRYEAGHFGILVPIFRMKCLPLFSEHWRRRWHVTAEIIHLLQKNINVGIGRHCPRIRYR